MLGRFWLSCVLGYLPEGSGTQDFQGTTPPRMRSQSAKAKGRRLQQFVRDALIAALDLPAEDVRSTSMGAGGEDLQLSAAACKVVPFAIECKNVESLNIHKALAQAQMHAKGGRHPLVVFSKNHTEVYAALPFTVLVQLLIYRAEQLGER